MPYVAIGIELRGHEQAFDVVDVLHALALAMITDTHEFKEVVEVD
jgi:hypothetical protein